jgi:muconolactone delta-isomerase
MIEINLPKLFNGELMKLIPEQRAFFSRMMKQGIIVNYSLSFDWQKLWVIINAEDRFDAKNIIGSFPMNKYINYQIHDLMFHESSSISSPQLWLN